MKLVLGALAAFAIAGLAFMQPAEARCFWNGFETVCVHHSHPFMYGERHFYRGYDWGYDRPHWWGGY